MNLLKRLKTIFRSNVNDAVKKNQNPEDMLNAQIEDMEKSVVAAETSVLQSVSSRNRMKEQYQRAVEESKNWEEKAMLALSRGDNTEENGELARQALRSQAEVNVQIELFKAQLDVQNEKVEELQDVMKRLKNKLLEIKNKRDVLIAESKNATAEIQIRSTLNENTTETSFQDMQTKVHELSSHVELMREQTPESFDETFEKELQAQQVEKKLEEMKKKLNQNNL